MPAPDEPFFIFVDGAAVPACAGQTALDAIAAWQPEVAQSLASSDRALTDSRGLATDPRQAAHAGAIFRVISARPLNVTDEAR
jgi:hypothetical protein